MKYLAMAIFEATPEPRRGKNYRSAKAIVITRIKF
jgi:hypothetical protein